MGRGTQERAEHAVLLFGNRCLCVVRAETGLAKILADGGPVCGGADGQADGHHAAVCIVAVGLLAAGPDAAGWNREPPGHLEGRAVAGLEAAAGKDPVALSFSRECGDHSNGAATCGAYLRRVPACHSNRECNPGLRAVLVENALASAACSQLSLPRKYSPGLAMDFIGAGFNRCHCSRCYLSPQGLLAGGMVLVSGHFGSGHRPGAGWRCRHGRSLRLHPADRNFRNDRLGPRRLGGGESSPHGLAGNPAIVRVAGFRPRHFSADKILGQRLRSVVAHAGGDGTESLCTFRPGGGAPQRPEPGNDTE